METRLEYDSGRWASADDRWEPEMDLGRSYSYKPRGEKDEIKFGKNCQLLALRIINLDQIKIEIRGYFGNILST